MFVCVRACVCECVRVCVCVCERECVCTSETASAVRSVQQSRASGSTNRCIYSKARCIPNSAMRLSRGSFPHFLSDQVSYHAIVVKESK